MDPLELTEFSESLKTKKRKQEGDILDYQYILIYWLQSNYLQSNQLQSIQLQ